MSFKDLVLLAAFLFLTQSSFCISRHCDFSNDGSDDLGMVVTGENGGIGGVSMMYGRVGEMSATNKQLFQPKRGAGKAFGCGRISPEDQALDACLKETRP